MSQLCQLMKAGHGQTIGAVADTIAMIDTAAVPGAPNAINGCGLHVEGVLIGRNGASGDNVTMRIVRAAAVESGVLSVVGSLGSISPARGSSALLTATGDIDAVGTTLRLRVTGVALLTLDWTGFLHVWSGEF